MTENQTYPLIPLRDIVLFPKMIAPLFVGRSKSIKALEKLEETSRIVLAAQKNSDQENPKIQDIYSVGVIARIVQTLKLPDGTLKILIEALSKVRINTIAENGGFFQAEVSNMIDIVQDDIETKALVKSVIGLFRDYIKLSNTSNSEISLVLGEIKDPSALADLIITNIAITVEKKQTLLELDDTKKRLQELLMFLEYEINLLKTEKKIKDSVKKQIDRSQKDYFLNEQLKAIHKELGNFSDGKNEVEELAKKIKTTKLSAEAREKAKLELNKLKMTNLNSSEASIIRNYLDYLLGLPWGKHTKLKHDIKHALKILNDDHYGLEKVKERIIEFLAVQKRTKTMSGPILCFVGPPGVGKTSLAKSIADATERTFLKFSLGGVRDEAEIRGHRKTYLGSMPGKILYLMRKGQADNPVILLDEIDKLSSDYRGDPAAALLEVLDPEQNNKFADHYLEVSYDLSKVLFIATANTTNLHPALLDRLELIRLSGYTEDEKLAIAQKHLMKKQRKNHKLSTAEFNIDDTALLNIIRHYTKESGVRNLERNITTLAQKIVLQLEQHKKAKTKITAKDLQKFLGVKKFMHNEKGKADLVGVTNGLAYTSVGGDMLLIEAVSLPGKGRIKATGKLGDVMQESAQIAFSYFKSTSFEYGVLPAYYSTLDLHVHAPEGATPKDGPSAGVTIFTSIVSVMTGIPVKQDIAMTGEITLSGRVLPIGGLKEKLLAAQRGKVKTVLIPLENVKDLTEIPKNVLKSLKIIPVESASEVIKHALVSVPKASERPKSDNIYATPLENTNNHIVTH